jgi:hypothetical protein
MRTVSIRGTGRSTPESGEIVSTETASSGGDQAEELLALPRHDVASTPSPPNHCAPVWPTPGN